MSKSEHWLRAGCKYCLKVPLLWIMKGLYFGCKSPQQQADVYTRSKTRLFSYMHLFLPYFLNDSLNDSLFQTRPLRDANLR